MKTGTVVRRNILLLAEAFDAWRVIPRLMLMAYGYLVFNLYVWYKNIPTYVQEKCDASIVADMMANGRPLEEIKKFACTVGDVVGGPTAAQSTFVTTIIGLSTGIFGLYTSTGRKWDGWEPQYHQDEYKHPRDKYEPKTGSKTNIQIMTGTDASPQQSEPVNPPQNPNPAPVVHEAQVQVTAKQIFNGEGEGSEEFDDHPDNPDSPSP
jgi:hypothetical protein